MDRIKKFLSTVLVMMLPLFCAYPIGFGYHILEIRTSPEFAEGVFPSSLVYQFNFPMPDIIGKSKTEFAFRLDNGLAFRTLDQDPDTGIPYASYPGGDAGYPRDYTVQFDEFKLFFAQGFVHTSFADDDLFTLGVSLNGRFENAFERLSWMSGPDETQGLFNIRPGEERFPDSSWTGAPELSGNRSSFMISVSASLDFNLMRDKITRRDGIKLSSSFRYAPSKLQIFGVSAEYAALKARLDISKTLYSIRQTGPRDTAWMSIVFDNSTGYSYIKGSMVPYFIQDEGIWETKGPNTEHVITNRTSLTFYGPQINSYDCYPYIMAFFDIGYSFGKMLNNNTGMVVDELYSAVGIRAEFIIFNIASIYYEIGYITDPVFNESRGIKQSFGFSLGI